MTANDPPVTAPPRRSGTERLMNGDYPVADARLSDFWSWSSSDLLSNALRGTLAEFIVGTALGCIDANDTRREWDAFDLKLKDGTTVEVKSTADLQSWGPTTKNAMRFGIAPTHAWHADTNQYDDGPTKRQAQVYVFCVFKHEDRASASPLNVDQWEFYVVPTALLNDRFPEQKTIGLASLRTVAGDAITYDALATAVHRAPKVVPDIRTAVNASGGSD